MTTIALLLSLLSLVISKAADFITTVRHVGREGESNPLARRFFHRLGFRRGLVAVAVIWLLIVGLTYGYAWLAGSPLMQWLTSVSGFLIAWAQWDSARFNRTGRASWFTRIALRQYQLWSQIWSKNSTKSQGERRKR